MAGLIGKKVGMTQIFTDDGEAVGVTVVEAGPCPVVQVKTHERDGYRAIQLGYGRVKEKRITKPEAGHAARAGLDYVPATLAEFDVEEGEEYEPGQELTVEQFAAGERVKVSGRRSDTASAADGPPTAAPPSSGSPARSGPARTRPA